MKVAHLGKIHIISSSIKPKNKLEKKTKFDLGKPSTYFLRLQAKKNYWAKNFDPKSDLPDHHKKWVLSNQKRLN